MTDQTPTASETRRCQGLIDAAPWQCEERVHTTDANRFGKPFCTAHSASRPPAKTSKTRISKTRTRKPARRIRRDPMTPTCSCYVAGRFNARNAHDCDIHS